MVEHWGSTRGTRSSSLPAPTPLSDELLATWRADETTPGAARHLIRSFLVDRELDALVDRAVLLTSEVVTNSLVHAPGDIGLRAARYGDFVRIEVYDRNPSLAQLVEQPDHRGRGLQIVASEADDWGSEQLHGGKVTWFALRDHPASG